MRIIEPSYKIETALNGNRILESIEAAGRTCYKSEDRITAESARAFVAGIIKSGHHSVIEHESMSVRFVVDRGVSHEIVRHRIASFSQESTRYCNYSKSRFGSELTFISPRLHVSKGVYDLWCGAMYEAESCYLRLIESGVKAQIARSVLPNSLKTELVMTANMREWRHFFALRTATAAHPQLREVARPLLREVRELVPVMFDDVGMIDEVAR